MKQNQLRNGLKTITWNWIKISVNFLMLVLKFAASTATMKGRLQFVSNTFRWTLNLLVTLSMDW